MYYKYKAITLFTIAATSASRVMSNESYSALTDESIDRTWQPTTEPDYGRTAKEQRTAWSTAAQILVDVRTHASRLRGDRVGFGRCGVRPLRLSSHWCTTRKVRLHGWYRPLFVTLPMLDPSVCRVSVMTYLMSPSNNNNLWCKGCVACMVGWLKAIFVRHQYTADDAGMWSNG